MILQYVDDSGDNGLVNSPTSFFILTTILIYEDFWNEAFLRIKEFRRYLKQKYGINLSEELKANHLVGNKGFARKLNLSEQNRIEIYKTTLNFISTLGHIKVFSVCIRKKEITKQNLDIFSFAWKLLYTRQHYTVNKLNKENNRNDKSIIISDDTNEDLIRKILRELRVINYVGGKNIVLDSFIEDPFMKKSHHSYFIQLCDMIAFCVAAKNIKSKSIIPFDFINMYKILEPVIEKSVSYGSDKDGIVYFPKK
jgi:hypothetical protein